jgi:predicted peptidase
MCPRTQIATVVTALLTLLTPSATKAADDSSVFLRRTYTNAVKAVLNYRLLVPKDYDATKEYPLVVFLHGAIARGNDNEEPLNWGPKLFLDPAARDKHPCFLMVPQCPHNEGWTATLLDRGSDALSLTLEVIRDRLPREYRIDPHRRYITGVSMGGIAAWGYLCSHPGFFAAGVPVCAAGTPSAVTAEATRHPVWVFHSDDDHLIPVQSARDMVKAWRDHGGTARYTEYTGLRHSSWKKAYIEPELFPWLFAQRLR